MGLTALLFSNPPLFFVLAFFLLYSIIIHEVAHGWVALVCGDDTAKRFGRLTLNPVPHFDPVGALMLLFVGFGWARPVPVDYYRLSRSRLGLFCVSLAGCAVNIFIAAVAVALMQFAPVGANPVLSRILPVLATINLMLGAFNLIPIPPLDGSKILMSFLPQRAQMVFARLEPYGFFILILLLFTRLLDPVIALMMELVMRFITAIFGLF
jgi:Zn-dependent protease